MDPLTEQLAEALRVCADDLEAEVSAKYPESMLAYPCMVADKEGDMANVVAARKLLAAYDAAKANGGWLPIESAPKDGTVISLLCSGRSVAGYWYIPKECEYCFDELDGAWYALIPDIWGTTAGRVVVPKKWQYLPKPLPPPPE